MLNFLSNLKFQQVFISSIFCILFSITAIAQEKKNLLFIMTDQQRYDALSIAGNTVLKTPNLDRLASQGAFFQNAYSPSAVCCPSRSSILTGHTIENTGMKNNDAYYDVDESVMAMPTFDEILAQQGYHCEYYGKWHTSSYHSDVYKNPQQSALNGKSIFGPGGQSYVYIDYLNEYATNRAPQTGEFADLISKFPYESDPLDKYHGTSAQTLESQNIKHGQPDQHGKLQLDKEHTLTAFQARQTIEALERLKDQTFSLTCSFHFPHSPMLPAEPYYSMYPPGDMIVPVSISDNMLNSPYRNANGRQGNTEYADPEKIKYMISNYYGLIAEIDDWVGIILDKLDELGLAENTLVIFASDHGEMLGAHGMREKNVFYEESSHIPLIMRFPNKIAPETTVDGYVSLVDLFPTILDYLEVPEHESNGKSLRGLIEGTDQEHGEYVVTEWDFRGDGESNYMIIKDGWKLMIPYSKSSPVLNALYNLNSDPHEMNNLIGNNPNAGQHGDKAEELRTSLLEWLEKNGSEHYNSVAARVLVGTQITSNAIFMSQNVPASMEPGEKATVSITFRNMGNSTWTRADNYVLGSQNPMDNDRWGIDRVLLDVEDKIAPIAQKTFTFEITAPTTTGRYNFQWRMQEEHIEWFGNSSNNVVINVGDVAGYLDDCDDKTDWKSSQALNLNTTEIKQGLACIEFTGDGTDEYKKVFSTPFKSDVTAVNGALQFWYYVSDPSMLSEKNQVEIGSAGKADENEYSWTLTGLTEGWNFVSLKISEAGKTGLPNLNSINWFRLYNKKTGSVITRIDAIQIVDNTSTGSLIFDKTSKEQSINIYPNPLTGDYLSINLIGFEDANNVEISITNLLGQTVYNKTTQNSNHDILDTGSLLKNSIYLVTAKSENSTISKKLIIE